MAINTSTVAIPFVAEFERNLPVLMNGNTQFDKAFVGGNGTSMNVLVPNYGSTGTGADMTSTMSTLSNSEKALALVQYHKGVPLTAVQKSLQLSNFDEQVAQPYGAEMASEVQKVAIDTMFNGATTAVIIESGTGDYKNMGKAISYIKANRGVGQMFMALSPELSSEVQDSGLSFFQADLKQNFINGSLGKFRNAQGYETPDIEDLNTGTHAIVGGLTVTADLVSGATSAVLTAGTSATGTIKAGEIIAFNGCKTVDVFGNVKGADRSITVKADATFASNAVTVTFDPIYTTGELKNIGGTGVVSDEIPATTVATIQTDASSTYRRGLVWCKQAFIVGSAKMDKLSQTKLIGSANGKQSFIMCQEGTDIKAGTDIYRWDTLKGFMLAKDIWVSQVLVKA